MTRNYRHRSSSIGSQNDSSSSGQYHHHVHNSSANSKTIPFNADDLETSKKLLSSILYMKDGNGKSFLHSDFQLSWAKALLDRTKSLDEYKFEELWQNQKESYVPNHNKRTSIDTAKTPGALLQRRFLLQQDQESGYTPFHRAIVDGNLAAILLFLRHTMDTASTERLTQRPITVLHAAEANQSNSDNSNSNMSHNNTLLQQMVAAVDHEGLTPLKLLGKLQRSGLSECRKALKSCQLEVDTKATTRLRPRQSSFGNDDDGVDFFSENADVLHTSAGNDDENAESAADNGVTYGCEVVTFGRPHHCALGVVQGGSASSTFLAPSTSLKGCKQYTHTSTFSPQRVQEFAQEAVGREGAAIAVSAATHHTLTATKNGHLYAFGLGKGGRLGLGQDQPQQCPLPKRVLGPLARRHVVSVAAAENHSLCLTKEGIVFSWGSNRFGQLGDLGVAIAGGTRNVPRRVEDLKQHFCIAITAGERHSVALSRKGEVFVWGDNTSGQLGVPRRSGVQKVQRVEALWGTTSSNGINCKIAISVAAAEHSTMVLTTGSNAALSHVNVIYEWGHGNHVPMRVHFDSARGGSSSGKLEAKGYGSTAAVSSRLVNPVAIACARYHSVAVTSDGSVYTWGLHAETLGRSSSFQSPKLQQRKNSLPQLVTGMLPENGGGFAVAVAASDQRTAVVCDNGSLFTWGSTDGKNVLGHEGLRWQHFPRQVPGVHRAVNVAVAKEHTVLLIGAEFPVVPKAERLPTLEDIAARKAAEHVDLFNVIPILTIAERTECSFLVKYCTTFIRRNLDGVLNVGKKSVMNQYLNDMLTDTYVAGLKFRDHHHHPYIFDVLQAGNESRPTFERECFPSIEQWVNGCSVLANSPVNRYLLALAATREYEEDVITSLKTKGRRSSSCYSDLEESRGRAHSLSEGCELPGNVNSRGSILDSCIKKTANMDLSTKELASEKFLWLSKEIRGVRKKLKQISHLLESETQSIVLSTEQKAKVGRRPALEAELDVFESAMEEVEKRIKELHEEDSARLVTTCSKHPLKEQKKDARVTFKKEESNSEGVTTSEECAASIEKNLVCSLCVVSCSDRSSFMLHQNGRKHRNRVAQAAEEEKEKTTASILEQQRIGQVKGTLEAKPPAKQKSKNAWGLSSSEPRYKLPPPPHPVVSQVMQKCATAVIEDTKDNAYPNEAKKVPSSPSSNFKQVLKTQKRKGNSGNTLPAIWDTTPNSTRCVPLSLYAVPDLKSSPKGSHDAHHSGLSLSDFLTPTKPVEPVSASNLGVQSPAWNAAQTYSFASAKALRQIQEEEATLVARQDKSSAVRGGSWFVQRRERAGSLLDIQSKAQQELEERLLVEEQLQIEAQIMEENRRAQLEKERKGYKRGTTKRGAGRTQNSKGNRNQNSKCDEKQEDNSKRKTFPKRNQKERNSRKNIATAGESSTGTTQKT